MLLINKKSSLLWIKGFVCLQVNNLFIRIPYSSGINEVHMEISSSGLADSFWAGDPPKQSKLESKVTFKSPPVTTFCSGLEAIPSNLSCSLLKYLPTGSHWQDYS